MSSGQKNISVVKNIALLQWRAVAKATWQAVITFLICGTFAVTVFTLCSVSGFRGGNENLWDIIASSPSLPCPLLSRLLFTISPNGELARRLSIFLYLSYIRHIFYTFHPTPLNFAYIYSPRAEHFLLDFGFYFFKASLEPYALCCKQNK